MTCPAGKAQGGSLCCPNLLPSLVASLCCVHLHVLVCAASCLAQKDQACTTASLCQVKRDILQSSVRNNAQPTQSVCTALIVRHELRSEPRPTPVHFDIRKYRTSAVWTYGWLWSERQGSEAMGGLCQGRPAGCRAFNYMVEEIPRQGRLEGCHRMSAATHLICGLEGV